MKTTTNQITTPNIIDKKNKKSSTILLSLHGTMHFIKEGSNH